MIPFKSVFAIALAVALTLSVRANAEPVGAGAFVAGLVDQVLRDFNDPSLTPAQREQRLHAVAVKAFDVPYTARFALGSYWKSASEQERTAFVGVYEDYIVHVYARRFEIHHDADFRVLSEHSEAPAHTVVDSEIVQQNGRPPIRVIWRVQTNGGTHKITNVTVDGISQDLALREQFAELIEHDHGGVAMLIDRLREKTRA